MKINHTLTNNLLSNMGLTPRDVLQVSPPNIRQWVFSDTLKNLSPTAHQYIVLNHADLNIMHEMLRVESLKYVHTYNDHERTQRIIAALLYAQALEYVYSNHVKTSTATRASLHKAQQFYHDYLEKAGISIPQAHLKTHQQTCLESLESAFYDATPTADFIRLLTMRSRRMFVFSVALFNTLETYGAWVMWLDPFVKSLLVYQACVLLPRTIINLKHILKHADNPAYRADPAFQLRCWEIAYDVGWIVHGLVGAFTPYGIYLTVLVPTYNLSVHTARFFFTRARFQALEKQYNTQLEHTQDAAQQAEIKALLICLHEKSQQALMPLAVRIGVCLTIISTASLILFFSVNPWVPFIAAALAVVATLAGKYIPKKLPKQLQALNEHNFSCPSNPLDDYDTPIPLPKHGSSDTVTCSAYDDYPALRKRSIFQKNEEDEYDDNLGKQHLQTSRKYPVTPTLVLN